MIAAARGVDSGRLLAENVGRKLARSHVLIVVLIASVRPCAETGYIDACTAACEVADAIE
jgi:hypothetical protein